MSELNLELDDLKPRSIEEDQDAQTYVIAGFNERFLAYLIDTLPFVLLTYTTFTFAVKYNYIVFTQKNETVWKLLWIALFILYEIIFTSGNRRTLGKKIMGIRVLKKDGSYPTVFSAFFRVTGYFISSFILNLGYIMAAFTPNKRALHDYMAGTIVVRTKSKTSAQETLILILSWAFIAFFVGSWINRTVIKISPYEKKQIEAARRTVNKIARLEEIHYRKYGFYTNDIRRLAALTGNVKAVRYEISKTLAPDSLSIASDGKVYIIKARAKNWRKTKVEISNLNN